MNIQLAGRIFSLDDPGALPIEAVASTLARNCRFNGSLRDDAPVIWHSVADHCVLVSLLMDRYGVGPGIAMLGLLHDAHECMTGDIPTPVKQWFGISVQEKRLEIQVLHGLGLREQTTPSALAMVKRADHEALRIEVSMLGLKPELFGFDEEDLVAAWSEDRRFCDAHDLLRPVSDIPLARVLHNSRSRFLNRYADLREKLQPARLDVIAIA